MISVDKKIINKQLQALIIFEFLEKFNSLERKIKKIFVESIKDINDSEIINKLHFYYGGKIGTYIDYANDTLKLNELKFDSSKEFSKFSLNQIIKLNRELKIIKYFDDKPISSINRSREDFGFEDCIIKLINMRNILSHELSNFNFKDKDTIEILSNDNILNAQFKFLSNYDISMLEESIKPILSNLFYMDKIINDFSEDICGNI